MAITATPATAPPAMAPIFKRLFEGVNEDGGEKLVGRAVPGVVELEMPELPIAAPELSSGVPPAVSDSEELQLFSTVTSMRAQ